MGLGLDCLFIRKKITYGMYYESNKLFLRERGKQLLWLKINSLQKVTNINRLGHCLVICIGNIDGIVE